MKKILSLILLSLIAYSFNSCGSKRTTVIVVQPKQYYDIVVEEISGVNPVGTLNVTVTNKYSSDTTEFADKYLHVHDLNDSYPITFQMVDDIKVYFEKTIILNDYLDAGEIILVDPVDSDNYIIITFSSTIES